MQELIEEEQTEFDDKESRKPTRTISIAYRPLLDQTNKAGVIDAGTVKKYEKDLAEDFVHVEEEEMENDWSHLPRGYKPSLVKLTLYSVFLSNLFFNIDMGIMPAGTVIIKKDLKLDTAKFGYLGSVVYFGNMLGAALASRMLTSCSPKYILIICMILNVFVLLVFTVTDDFYVLAASRALTGTFQIFFGIF